MEQTPIVSCYRRICSHIIRVPSSLGFSNIGVAMSCFGSLCHYYHSTSGQQSGSESPQPSFALLAGHSPWFWHLRPSSRQSAASEWWTIYKWSSWSILSNYCWKPSQISIRGQNAWIQQASLDYGPALMVLTEAVWAEDKAAFGRTAFSSGRWHTWRGCA